MAGIKIPISINDGASTPLTQMAMSAQQMTNQLAKMQQMLSKPVTPPSTEEFKQPLSDIGNQTQRNTQYQREHNQAIREGTPEVNSLLGAVKNLVGAYLSLQGIKKLVSMGDEFTGIQARLGMITGSQAELTKLNKQLFASAQRTRSEYAETANTVGKLGLLAKDAFSSNEELVRFSELMNQSFKASGASIMEQKSAMLQLTQAMASGRLQGDEFRSILENAPMLAQAIKKELGGIDLKKASSEGLITADVIKRAMFNSADEIQEKFSKMPMTFGEAIVIMKNNFMMGLAPMFKAMNDLWNNPIIKGAVLETMYLFQAVGQIGAAAFNGINSVLSFVASNMAFFAPILFVILGALTATSAVLLVSKAIALAKAGADMLMTAAMVAYSLATTRGATAQVFFNSAILACPIFWIVFGILALIAAIYIGVAAFNKLTGSAYSATGLIFGVFFALGAAIANIFKAILSIAILLCTALVNGFLKAAHGIGQAFIKVQIAALNMAKGVTNAADSVAQNIANAFVSGANKAIHAINWIIKALNKIPGVNLSQMGQIGHVSVPKHSVAIDNKIAGLQSQLGGKAQHFDYKTLELTSIDKAFNSGMKFGKGLENKVKGLFKHDIDKDMGADMAKLMKDMGKQQIQPEKGGAGGAGRGGNGAKLADIAKNTRETADNTNMSKDEIRYLREIAERNAINKFTTAEIKIDNTIHASDVQDLDGFVDHLTNKMAEQLEIQAEGHYAF